MLGRIARAMGQAPEEPYITAAIGAVNSQRIKRLLMILVLVHLAHVLLFWARPPGMAGTTYVWRNGIMATHAMMILLIAVLLPVQMMVGRNKRISSEYQALMSGLVALLFLSLGAVLAIIDQLVTAAITPLLIASTGVAVAIAVRPAVAAFNYALVLALFIVGVSWTQPSAALLLTVRVNSLTAISLGFGLSLLQWRNQTLAIRQQRRIEEQQRELEETNRKLTLLATRDVLTGLLNRAQFNVDAESEVARMRSAGSQGCLVMLDVDHFKLVNDTYGHPSGDSILVGIAHLLSRRLRRLDLLARFGGEEFALLLPDTPLTEGVQFAEQLCEAITAEPFAIGGQPMVVTASLGVAELLTDSAEALTRCYHAADKALYQAKQDGRNCVRWAQQKDRVRTHLG